MADVKDLLSEVQSDPNFAQATAVVDLIRQAGDLLTQMRTQAGLTQAELAERLGISIGRVSQLESGTLRNAPSLKTMAQFATACGTRIDIAVAPEKAGASIRETGLKKAAAAY